MCLVIMLRPISCAADNFLHSYLGLQLYESGLVSHLMTPLKAKMTVAWAVVQKRYALLRFGDTVNLKIKLLQTT